MSPHRLLLVPELTELEWTIKSLLEEWAEVASFDAPGVGERSPTEELGPEAVAERGLEELDRRGWDRCVVVADEAGALAAAHLAAARPDAIEGFAFGHARLSDSIEGERPAMNGEVYAAMAGLVRQDHRTFVRQIFKASRGEEIKGGYGEDLVAAYLERVSPQLLAAFYPETPRDGAHMGRALQGLDAPLLFVQHQGCLLYTTEGYDDAVASFPAARTAVTEEKPSTSAEFARELRSFCQGLGGEDTARPAG